MASIKHVSAGGHASSASARTFWERFGIGLTILIVPLLLLALPLPPAAGKWAQHKRDWVLGVSIAISILSAVAYLVPTPLFPRRRSTLPLIVLGTALLVLAHVGWNRAYLDYVSKHKKEYSREVFRKAMHNYWAPVYGRYDNAFTRLDPVTGKYSTTTLPWAMVSLGIAAAWYLWARRRPIEKKWDGQSLAVLLSFQLALVCAFAACESWPTRFSLKISGYSEFKKDIPAFDGIADTLQNYVGKMPQLEWYGQHYPPGNLILLEIEKMLGLPGMTKTIVVLLSLLSAIPLVMLAKELDLPPPAVTASLFLFTATTGVLIYSTINTTSLILFPGTLCLWMLMRGLRTGSIPAAGLLGLGFAFYLFFSFSASILGVLMALTTVIAWWTGATSLRNVLRTGVIALAALAAVIGVVYATSHFNLIACFQSAVRGHQAQQGNEGFDDLRRYLLRSTGNILAYALSIIPLCILAACAIKDILTDKTYLSARALFIALGLTVLIAGFSGLFYIETERIWIFLTPVFALAAGHELSRRTTTDGSRIIHFVLLLVLVISCTQELLFMHYR